MYNSVILIALQVRINSMSEFVKLYYNNGTRKATEKVGPKIARRSHKGLMICVLSDSGNPNSKVVGKMNFVDLAGTHLNYNWDPVSSICTNICYCLYCTRLRRCKKK